MRQIPSLSPPPSSTLPPSPPLPPSLPPSPPSPPQVTRTGHAFTHLRDVGGQFFSYEGSTYLFDGEWHHLAVSWDGSNEQQAENTLSLYVDGRLEIAGGPGDDESGEPKHPGRASKKHAAGYKIAAQCGVGLCEEGMHIGGFYQSGGKGYTGQVHPRSGVPSISQSHGFSPLFSHTHPSRLHSLAPLHPYSATPSFI